MTEAAGMITYVTQHDVLVVLGAFLGPTTVGFFWLGWRFSALFAATKEQSSRLVSHETALNIHRQNMQVTVGDLTSIVQECQVALARIEGRLPRNGVPK